MWVVAHDGCRYGTPFLQTLGLSEHLTSLVWLAGPISGLVAQPVIGKQAHPYIPQMSDLSRTLSLSQGPYQTLLLRSIDDVSGSFFRPQHWLSRPSHLPIVFHWPNSLSTFSRQREIGPTSTPIGYDHTCYGHVYYPLTTR